MKAKYKQSIQQQPSHRLELKEQLPLNTPLSMQIELASACNFKCKFCMHGNDELIKEGKYKIGIMPMDVFKKVVDDLKKFPQKLKFITLQSRGESLLNPNISEMVRLIKEAEVAEKIALYTNGSLLTHKLGEELVEAGLDVLHISIEGINSQQYKEVAGVNLDFEDLVEKTAYFYQIKKETYLYVKTIDVGMKEEEKELFLKTFGDICDSIFIEQPVDAWKGAGLDNKIFKENRYKADVKKVEVCPRLFFAFVVHFDGTVVSCDMDWMENDIIGNVMKQSLTDLWNGDNMNKLRTKHIEGKADKIERCDKCISRTECLISDDIDEIADKLRMIYK